MKFVLQTFQEKNIHIQSVHEERKPFQCEICDRSFTQKSHITAHHRLFHGDKKARRDSNVKYAWLIFQQVKA